MLHRVLCPTMFKTEKHEVIFLRTCNYLLQIFAAQSVTNKSYITKVKLQELAFNSYVTKPLERGNTSLTRLESR